MSESKRQGSILISKELLHSSISEECLSAIKFVCTFVRPESRGVVLISGHSPFFDELPGGSIIPEYELIVSRHTSGIAVDVEKVG